MRFLAIRFVAVATFLVSLLFLASGLAPANPTPFGDAFRRAFEGVPAPSTHASDAALETIHIHLRLVDAHTNAPIANAVVAAAMTENSKPGQNGPATTTDASGRARIETRVFPTGSDVVLPRRVFVQAVGSVPIRPPLRLSMPPRLDRARGVWRVDLGPLRISR